MTCYEKLKVLQQRPCYKGCALLTSAYVLYILIKAITIIKWFNKDQLTLTCHPKLKVLQQRPYHNGFAVPTKGILQ